MHGADTHWTWPRQDNLHRQQTDVLTTAPVVLVALNNIRPPDALLTFCQLPQLRQPEQMFVHMSNSLICHYYS